MRVFKKVTTILLMIVLLVFAFVPVYADTVEQDTGQITSATDIPGMIINMLVIPILPLVSAFLVALIRKKLSEIEQNIYDNRIKKYVNIAEDAVCTAVTAVSQTYVEALKNNSQFDQAAQQAAFNKAKNKALAIMGTAAQQALKDTYTDFDAWLENKIEYYVNVSKSPVTGVKASLIST